MPFEQFKVQYEGLKASHEAELSAVEGCMSKCSIGYQNDAFYSKEEDCLKKCFIKYFDASLLVEKEMQRHTVGAPFA